MKIDRIVEKYLMERFSMSAKSISGSGSTKDKINNLADYAATVSVDWMNIRRGQFWDFSKYDQLFVIDRDLDRFIRSFGEDLEDSLQVPDLKQFIEKNRKEIVKNIRKSMFRIYGE